MAARYGLIAALALCGGTCVAQEWPARPVKFIAAVGSGSSMDVQARFLGDLLSRRWNHQVVIENRAGAAGILGTQAAIQQPPDGHNFSFIQAAPLALVPHVFKSVPYDVERDLVPVVGLGFDWMMLAVNPQVKARDLPELMALAKQASGTVFFATSGNRNLPHLTGEMLNQAAGIRLVHVSYKTSDQAATDTIGGRTQVWIGGMPAVMSHVRSGRLRALAVAAPGRLPQIPDVPAIAETLPGFAMGGWAAIMAPRGTPDAVVARLNRDVNAILKSAEYSGKEQTWGVHGSGGTREELAALIRSEHEKFRKIVSAARINPE